jgi:hypothetical protein
MDIDAATAASDFGLSSRLFELSFGRRVLGDLDLDLDRFRFRSLRSLRFLSDILYKSEMKVF